MGIPGTCEVPMFPAGNRSMAPDRRSKEPGGQSRARSVTSESSVQAGAERRIHKSLGRGMWKS